MTAQTEKKTLGMVLKGYPRISETFISNENPVARKKGIQDSHLFHACAP